jgi:hypothetical protein
LVKVIFTATTGVSKAAAIRKIISKALLSKGYRDDLRNIDSMKFVRYFDFEEMMQEEYQTPLWSFFTSLNTKLQQDVWNGTFDKIANIVKQEQPKHVFISLHATFFTGSKQRRFLTES